ncbi:Prostatic acid phosphatase, partial [Pseudolycoriella hygida]
EKLLAWNIPCPRFEFLFEQYTNSEEYNGMYEKFNSSIKEWEEHSGKTLEKLVDIMYLYDTLYVEHRKSFELPYWAINALESNSTMEYLAAFHLQAFTSSTELRKLEVGFVIKEMLDRFNSKSLAALQPNRSLWVYSAHDLSIVNILNGLGLYELHIPPYASSLHFELYENGTNFYIQIFYRKDNEEILSPLRVPNCGVKCSLHEFYKLYDEILPDQFEDYSAACQHEVKSRAQN